MRPARVLLVTGLVAVIVAAAWFLSLLYVLTD